MKRKNIPLTYMPHPFSVSGNIGSLDAYIAVVNAYPMLTAEEEYTLAQKFRTEQDLSAVHQLIVSHLRVVVSVARRYLGYGLQYADLIQEGNIGLMKAIKRFDETRGVRLVTFALYWIKAEIHEFIIRNWKMVKTVTTKAKRKLFFKLRSLRTSHTGSIQPKEAQHIADQLQLSVKDVLDMEQGLQQDTSLDTPYKNDDDISLLDTLPSHTQEPSTLIEEVQSKEQQERALQEVFNTLDDRMKDIIFSRHLSEEPLSLNILAQRYSISMERVRQIERAGLEKMRRALMAAGQAH